MKRAVRNYLTEHKPRKDRELQHHRELASMPAAIREAVLPCGRIHPHQRRQGYEKMGELRQQLTPLSRRPSRVALWACWDEPTERDVHADRGAAFSGRADLEAAPQIIDTLAHADNPD